MDPSQGLNWTLINEMAESLAPEQRQAAEWRMGNTGKISMNDFKIAIGCLFGLASLAFLGRLNIRLAYRRRIFLDDGFLILSFVCLIASTAVFYKRARYIYLVFSLMRGDETISLIASQEIDEVYDQLNWSFSYIACLWTAIFMVKLSYFALFHTLLKSMPKRLIRYFWAAASFTVVAWLYLVLQQLITCPYFGKESFKCFPDLPISGSVLNFLFWTGPVLDGLTDVTLILIPVMVLSKSQMALVTKIGFGVFLCLSLFMLACSITRAAGTYYQGSLDTPWQVFWLHAEACVGVLMASVTVYRSVLIGSAGSASSMQRFLDRIIRARSSETRGGPSEQEQEQEKKDETRTGGGGRFGRFLLSKIPTSTLTGLATLFADGDGDTLRSETTTHSILGDVVLDEQDYHSHLRTLHQPNAPSQDAGITVHSSTSVHSEQGKC